MKISVIIPAYNCEKYIKACLDSVINQTYSDIEIILIDDGSTDSTGVIIDEYAEKYSFIKVFHQKNCGVSHARNVGLNNITGDIVSFIDSDDTLDLDMYQILIENMMKFNVDIVHCGYKHIVGEEIRLVHDTGKLYKQNRQEALGCLIGGHLFVGSLCNKLFKVSLIGNLTFNENLKINEDILFNFEAFNRSNESVFIDLAKYNYIAHRGTSAVFATEDVKKSKDAAEVSKLIYDKLDGEEIQKIARERYLRSLSGLYRCNAICRNERKSIAREMWHIYNSGSGAGRNMTITTYLIYFVPTLYLLTYRIYNRIRKPNWEV